MLTRLHADNWRSFVNFELTLDSTILLLGDNGSGKTGVFDLLRLLKGLLLDRRRLDQLLPAASKTRWDGRQDQRFEFDLAGNGGIYRYSLVVRHHPQATFPGEPVRAVTEALLHNDHVVARFEQEQLSVYDDQGNLFISSVADPSFSPIGNVFTGPRSGKLTWFKRRLAAIYTFHIDPRHMDPWSEASDPHPSDDLGNFAAWFRSLQQRKFSAVADAFTALADIIPGFKELVVDSDLHERGRLRLRCGPIAGMPATSFDFAELSDGQRALIALYTIRHALIGPETSVWFDEPDNFVALRELQPWLFSILDETLTDSGAQVVLISHNAELIDRLAHDHGQWFFREGGGPTRVRPFVDVMAGPLAASAQLARGVDL